MDLGGHCLLPDPGLCLKMLVESEKFNCRSYGSLLTRRHCPWLCVCELLGAVGGCPVRILITFPRSNSWSPLPCNGKEVSLASRPTRIVVSSLSLGSWTLSSSFSNRRSIVRRTGTLAAEVLSVRMFPLSLIDECSNIVEGSVQRGDLSLKHCDGVYLPLPEGLLSHAATLTPLLFQSEGQCQAQKDFKATRTLSSPSSVCSAGRPFRALLVATITVLKRELRCLIAPVVFKSTEPVDSSVFELRLVAQNRNR